MKTKDLLIQNEYNPENYENIISVIEQAAAHFGVKIDIIGTSWGIVAGDYEGALMDIETRAIQQLREEYPEVF
ncbi:Uncharacterised protein [Odoribacter splanchnicus]|jgi:hypothetical protein|uniref:hypothetical protein n=1 Tax=Odoribacter splanchnicus TaxID=28118 RepID=UPI000D9C271A|nr:hypothetical protein [Odoribacter splanchnicus]SPY23628.1 Uncharacterised protein [Odoribacter splanchnicus]